MTSNFAMNEDDTIRQHLLELDAEEHIDFDFVAREAGDRAMSPAERQRHESVRRNRGDKLYSDLMFVLTHKRYSSRRAKQLWQEILNHKAELESTLERDAGITVATVDYLTNFAGDIIRPTVIAEPKISAVAEIATRDGMTGLYDHASFQVALSREVQRFQRYGQPVSLIMFDVDHFKRYNDSRGHVAGDKLLVQIAQIIEAEIRDLDVGARYGGEEFAVIAPSTNSADAYSLAERIRCRVADDFDDQQVTVSAGVATATDNENTTGALVEAADTALYRAKERGRNRTCKRDP